ncbi:hypothetical protein RRG08_054946 [Elysia crispata]|uniref:Uncharacterized protein n=1 Tax=Elysia crispata TaxID=231223 RepID=A0AAE1D6L3_9GAST|nr:hypothetical protein RRG08_054946 [Elysia crispata]
MPGPILSGLSFIIECILPSIRSMTVIHSSPRRLNLPPPPAQYVYYIKNFQAHISLPHCSQPSVGIFGDRPKVDLRLSTDRARGRQRVGTDMPSSEMSARRGCG